MGKWTGVVPNVGAALLANWIDEKLLTFDGADAGTGVAPAAALLAQTALVNKKQAASVTGHETISKGIKLRIQLTAPQVGYRLNQFGVWASLEAETRTLIALFQNDEGVPIPSHDESPDFVYTFYGTVAINNEGNLAVIIDTSATVSLGVFEEAIATKQDKIFVDGLLKGDGNGGITAARPGSDYGLPLATGHGAPTGSTQGTTGQHYYDDDTGQEYVCKGKDASGNFIWKLSGATSASDLTYKDTPLDEALGRIEDDVVGLQAGKADLDPVTKKVVADQLPDLDYDPAGTADTVVTEHNDNETAHPFIQEAVSTVALAAGAAAKAAGEAGEAASTAQKTADDALGAITKLLHTIDAVPSQNGSLTYTGSAQVPSWNSYNPETLTLGGVTTGTNAGTYTAKFTPKEGYTWSDGTNATKNVSWTIGRASISVVPSQTGSLTYTGSAQSPTWKDYNSGQLTIGGTTSAINAGTSTATFTPASNYQWADGKTTEKSATWGIGKATIVNVPAQSGGLTYTGNAQSPAWSNYNSAQLEIGGTSSATDAGTYTATFTPTNNYQWSGGSTAAKNASWSIGKAAGSLALNKTSITLTESAMTNTITVTRAGNGSISAVSSNANIASVSVSGTTVTVTGKTIGSVTVTVSVAEGSNHTAPANKTCSVTVDLPRIFGVVWNYANSSTALSRLTTTNDPNGLVTTNISSEPSPAVGNGAGSSPFDSYAPWKDMEEFNIISNAVSYKRGASGFSRTSYDTAVFIPNYYFKIVDDATNSKRYFYVADKSKGGFTKHPGSGKYVGRYNTISGNFSKSGATPYVSMTRAVARSGAKAKGSKWSLHDYASWCAVWLLYLVEFADWDSQKRIGRGNVDSGSVQNVGATDSMSYHTGRVAGTDGHTQVQYRHIENPWGNVREWIDGANFSERTSYICTNPANYADDTTSNYTAAGITLPSSGYPIKLGLSGQFPWSFLPTTVGGSETTFVPDYLNSNAGWRCLNVGGYYSDGSNAGLFYFSASYSSSDTSGYLGARLLFHP